MNGIKSRMRLSALLGFLVIVVAGSTFAAVALLVNIFHRKAESARPYVRLVEVTENDTDPAKWGINWPKEYDSYRRTVMPTRTKYGGHGGSEALPAEKIDRDPWLKRMFLGYAFSIDYRDRRGHAYMLEDQEGTKRLTKPQSGSCLHCHASIMPLYRKLGNGDAIAGLDATYTMSYSNLNAELLLELIKHLFGAPDITGCSQTDTDRMQSPWCHRKEGVECYNSVDLGYRYVQPFGNNLLDLCREISEVFLA